jgi:hypothetical protein
MCVDVLRLAQCSMAYHHFESPEDITKILASFLKPSGMLIVINIRKSDTTLPAEDANPAVFHRIVAQKRGLDHAMMRRAVESAGLLEFSTADLEHIEVMGGKEMKFIVSSAVKPATKA